MLLHELLDIDAKPAPYEFYTTEQFWNDPHISTYLLKTHLDPDDNAASRMPDFLRASHAWIQERFALRPGLTVCDFGCGPGLYATEFARQGATVTGIDCSERSIAYARDIAEQENLPITYIRQNYLDVQPARQFDFITMIYCDFCVLSPAQRAVLLETFRSALAEGGHLLLDVSTQAFFDQKIEERRHDVASQGGFWSPRPYAVFHNAWKYDEAMLLLDKFTVVEEHRARAIYNWLQCYTLDSLRREFAAHDLAVIEHYADVAGTPYADTSETLAVVAQRARA